MIFAKATQSFQSLQRSNRSIAFILAVVRKYDEDSIGYRAALLTYYGFISLFPFLLVATTFLKLTLKNNSALRARILHGALTYFPLIGQDLQQNVRGFASSGLALIIGLLLTMYGAKGVADVMRNTLDRIWRTPTSKVSTFPRSFTQSVLIMVIGGVGFILAPTIASYTYILGKCILLRFISLLITVAILFVVLTLLIRVGLSVRRTLRDIWIGALLSAVSLGFMESIGSFILASQLRHLNSLYGTFALVLGLLYWIYLQSQLLLIALEINTVHVLRSSLVRMDTKTAVKHNHSADLIKLR